MKISAKQQAQIVELFQSAYQNVTKKNGLREFTETLRSNNQAKTAIKTQDLFRLFSDQVWREEKVKSGHKCFCHLITGEKIIFSNHQKDLKTGAAVTILEKVQKIMNIMGNKIFQIQNWDQTPDYPAALKRWLEWEK